MANWVNADIGGVKLGALIAGIVVTVFGVLLAVIGATSASVTAGVSNYILGSFNKSGFTVPSQYNYLPQVSASIGPVFTILGVVLIVLGVVIVLYALQGPLSAVLNTFFGRYVVANYSLFNLLSKRLLATVRRYVIAATPPPKAPFTLV